VCEHRRVSGRLILDSERDLVHGVAARRWRTAHDDGDRSPILADRASAHDTLEVAFVESGVLRYRVGSRELVAHAGDIVVIPPHVEHRTDVMTTMHGGALKIERAHFDDVARALDERVVAVPLTFTSTDVTSLARVVTSVGASASKHVAADALVHASLCDAILARVVEALSTTTANETRASARDPRVRIVVELIHDRFREPLSVDDMARAAGTSRHHLSRLVKAATGKAPYELLLDVRLAEAARLLRTRAVPVTTAALDAGFTDVSRFGVQFKLAFGVTPSAYREARARS